MTEMLPALKTDMLLQVDKEWMKDRTEQFQERFKNRPIFRSLFEMENYVCGNASHPTPDAKYWQMIGEQAVHVQELVTLDFEFKKTEVELKKLERKLDKETDELERELIEIEIAQTKYAQVNRGKIAKERLREVKNCEIIINKIEPNLKFGNLDYEGHIPEREHLRDLVKTSNQFDLPSIESCKDPVFVEFFRRDVAKILIVTPHRKKIDGNVTNLTMLQPPSTFTVKIIEPPGMTVPDARNFAFHKALTEDYEWVFFIGDDNIVPKLALVQLIASGEKFIGGMYYRKYEPLESVAMIEKNGRPAPIRDNDFKMGDIMEVLVLPSDCTLIHRSLIEAIEAPWYKSFTVQGKPTMTEDTYFSGKAKRAGFKPMLHTGVQVLHIDLARNKAFGHPDIIKNNVLNPNYLDYFCTTSTGGPTS